MARLTLWLGSVMFLLTAAVLPFNLGQSASLPINVVALVSSLLVVLLSLRTLNKTKGPGSK
ncbi:hypothetical protein AB1K54_03050 [Microbacterium sp. BWT-B31]|uniref:hypothetical protein n=1 Tax=Microbacterium sp. BWT-B31 TaxID=3232072 RepID=UPI0035274327